jgi:hypothetical protein
MLYKYATVLLACIPLLGAAHSAAAAPFCVQITGIAPECLYDDAALCRLRANQLKGLCVANPDELRIVTGNQRYCLVSGDRASLCQYADRQTCERDAAREGQAACIDNVPAGGPGDPFRTEPARRY